ncbi:zinc finger CCCH domain-containing protein 39 [Salvia miltiorrhiza]|uniref:zinc finger CCCH domain-containing protein 39 n=1 Tax=Salvia miltiorrhiza TaxID=226208 RepID=UPI0025AB6FD9|nr:zinc finger CCCH domain-containing protein 39 [Salvia miltiorrhiza]
MQLRSPERSRMSFPDPTQPPNPFISPPYSGGDAAAAYWPPFWAGSEQQQQQHPDLMQQFHQSKKPRISEKAPNFAPFQPMNPRINQTNVPNPNPNPINKGTSHIFYKTRICAKFMEGSCRNGEQCTFAHGVEDLREPPPNWQELIREKERGNGGGGWGDDQRMIHRMKICKKYYNGEECPYGDKCNFLHERPSPPLKKLKVDMPGQRETSAISIGVTGNTGELDPAAPGWKMRICSRWEMGQCNYGERCHFAHGNSELRFSGSIDEGESAAATNAVSAARKVASVCAFPTTSAAAAAAAAPTTGDGEEKRISKWKLTKKINRIYADWLDDLTPPHLSPTKEMT